FRTWTERIDAWWPQSHRPSGDAGAVVGLEGYEDGRIFERTSEGVEHVWGKVIAWEPTWHFGYDWYLGSGVEQPTRVDVVFRADGDGTRVEVTHRGPELVGEIWTRNVARYVASWDVVLSAYLAACDTQEFELERMEGME
ncbi:MAG: hypothetical protein ABIQ44_10135, partial [Chloroflexia bacterium]